MCVANKLPPVPAPKAHFSKWRSLGILSSRQRWAMTMREAAACRVGHADDLGKLPMLRYSKRSDTDDPPGTIGPYWCCLSIDAALTQAPLAESRQSSRAELTNSTEFGRASSAISRADQPEFCSPGRSSAATGMAWSCSETPWKESWQPSSASPDNPPRVSPGQGVRLCGSSTQSTGLALPPTFVRVAKQRSPSSGRPGTIN